MHKDLSAPTDSLRWRRAALLATLGVSALLAIAAPLGFDSDSLIAANQVWADDGGGDDNDHDDGDAEDHDDGDVDDHNDGDAEDHDDGDVDDLDDGDVEEEVEDDDPNDDDGTPDQGPGDVPGVGSNK